MLRLGDEKKPRRRLGCDTHGERPLSAFRRRLGCGVATSAASTAPVCSGTTRAAHRMTASNKPSTELLQVCFHYLFRLARFSEKLHVSACQSWNFLSKAFLLAGAFMGTGDSAVASNIVSLTYRIQRWNLTDGSQPDISDSKSDHDIFTPLSIVSPPNQCTFAQNKYISVTSEPNLFCCQVMPM